ncbi:MULTISPECIES: DUF177 domain-containing protein [unclassified Variovorax]|jgi:uncharacterized protein|uniref:YceD family protein n=1 Tax=Variovorax TaxID=34072 RepID=UPI0008ED5D20|nr:MULTISPECIES: DUF177 domain-containing protein [unclassified Variovorax]KAF1067950.1 MAG: Large ribosomal RNA subunit accumulation protein YceD [Variovorax sp.]TAJ64339.1 MAG: DUF177 domain-containing protein [Variovorax sp.]SFP18609.1 uncharacterized protein SAMN05443579_109105 [Variovorax sp. PDC80]
MKREFAPGRLDVAGFAAAAATLSADDPVRNYTRLVDEMAAEAPSDAVVHWEADGEQRVGADGREEPWLHLTAEATVPLVCQRCLSPVDTPVQVDRWFRFVADEETAAVQDEESEEDLLVASRDFDLHALIEDELLMEIPVMPVHDVCPAPVQLSAVDPDFESPDKERENPFAVLGALRSRKPGQGD